MTGESVLAGPPGIGLDGLRLSLSGREAGVREERAQGRAGVCKPAVK